MTIHQTKISSTDLRCQPLTLNEITRVLRGEADHTVAVISDVHLGHGRVHASKIIAYLKDTFPAWRLTLLDMVVITGDLFDKLLKYGGDDAVMITRWLDGFLRDCAHHNVMVRILEGTPSHDNKQSRWLPFITELAGINLDIRYYDTPTIDTLWDGGPLALWIPDEVNHDANDTWMQVNELMRLHGTSYVDYAFMHGMFTFQEPVRTVVSHNVDNYLSIVRQRIYIGHHHTHCEYDRITVPGSPERLRHNEEEAKGHLQFTIASDYSAKDEYFIINPDATVFSTVDLQGVDLKTAIKRLEAVEEWPQGSHVRLLLSRSDEAYPAVNEIKARFPQFNLSTKVVEVEVFASEEEVLMDPTSIVAIRPDTIRDKLMARIKGESAEVYAEIDRILNAA